MAVSVSLSEPTNVPSNKEGSQTLVTFPTIDWSMKWSLDLTNKKKKTDMCTHSKTKTLKIILKTSTSRFFAALAALYLPFGRAE